MNSTIVRAATVILVAYAVACARDIGPSGRLAPSAPPLASNQVLATNATVRFVDLEGGCWALETEAGTYSPTSLPPRFRVSGLAVYIVAHGSPTYDFCMIAPLVWLDSIRAR